MSDLLKAAVIGHPVGHSKSPLIHNYWLKKYGIAGRYEALDVVPEDLEKSLKKLAQNGYAGFNVTLPYKEKVMSLCDGVDALAKNIGAVNLVTVEDGLLMGSNSDAFGFIGAVRHDFPDFDFKQGPVVMLGAGGAARAILHGLLEEGAPEIRIVNRTIARAGQIAQASCDPARVQNYKWENITAALKGTGMLVNATSLGMDGQAPLNIALDGLPQNALVADIVYKPLETRLLQAASERGHRTIGGIGMLLHQARPAFQAWFGVMPEIDETLIKMVSA